MLSTKIKPIKLHQIKIVLCLNPDNMEPMPFTQKSTTEWKTIILSIQTLKLPNEIKFMEVTLDTKLEEEMPYITLKSTHA